MKKRIFFALIGYFVFWVAWQLLSAEPHMELSHPKAEILHQLYKSPRKWPSELHYERDMNHYVYGENNESILFQDVPVLQYRNKEVLIFSSGPFSIDAGYRFFLPLKQTRIDVISRHSLERIKLIRLGVEVNRLMLHNDSLFVRYNENRYGRLEY